MYRGSRRHLEKEAEKARVYEEICDIFTKLENINAVVDDAGLISIFSILDTQINFEHCSCIS